MKCNYQEYKSNGYLIAGIVTFAAMLVTTSVLGAVLIAAVA